MHRCRWLVTYSGGHPIKKLLTASKALLVAPLAMIRHDIVHIHLVTRTSLYRKFGFFILAKILRKRILLHFHSSDVEFHRFFTEGPSLGRWILRNTFERADIVVALSESWVKRLAVFPHARVVSLANPAEIQPVAVPDENRDAGTVLYLGKLEKRKGYDDLVRAMPIVMSAVPKASLVLAGNGELQQALHLADTLGIKDRVACEGWVSTGRRNELLDKCSVLCLPSYHEGVPMAILEAMGRGVAVVSTPVGGIPDVIQSKHNGLLVEPGNVQAIADALIRVLKDVVFRRVLQANARATAIREFSVAIVSKRLSELYCHMERQQNSSTSVRQRE